MKEMMLSMMLPMMPYMKGTFMTGSVLAVAALVLLILGLFLNARGLLYLAAAAGMLALIIGLFFIGAQIAGMYLDMNPEINFGDSTKFEFITYAFWKLGLGLAIVGYLARNLAKRNQLAK